MDIITLAEVAGNLACHFTGFDSGFMQFFRVRETSMKMAEILTGARKTYGLNLIGGIRRDLLKDDMIQTRQLAQQNLYCLNPKM